MEDLCSPNVSIIFVFLDHLYSLKFAEELSLYRHVLKMAVCQATLCGIHLTYLYRICIKAELVNWDFLKIRETGPSKGLLVSPIVNNKLRMEHSAL